MTDKTFYGRLKKLFSSSAIVRNAGGKKLKVVDTDQSQATVSNAMRERYARMHSQGYGGAQSSAYTMNMAYQSQRIMLFRDYDTMDMDSIISSALDIYADESTVKNENGQILKIECADENIKAILENLFYDILNIEFNLFMWVRSLCKYGDFFLFLEISPEYGVHNVIPLSVYDTIRVEGSDVDNPYYVYFETMGATGAKQKLENFEIAHFRIIGDSNFLPYGRSMLEGARRVFRQLILMEDAMLIHRIMRAPEKRLFYVDVGNLPPGEVDAYMEKLMASTKKIPLIDPNTGEYNQRYNMQNLLEDFYFPVRGSDSGTRVENLAGLDYQAIEDIEYLKNRMLAALKIPKAFLGYEESISGKTTLAAEDARFARTIERIHRIVQSELTKIAIIHLYSQGYEDDDLTSFKLVLTNPSIIYEQEKVNLWKERIVLARDMKELKMLSEEWIYENIFNMSNDETRELQKSLISDVKRSFRYMQIEQGQSDPGKFGYPQDTPQTSYGAPGEEGAEAPAGDQQPVGEGTGRVGRPSKGLSYGQDNHPRGRDPLGGDELDKTFGSDTTRKVRKKFPLSLEGLKNISKNNAAKASILNERMSVDELWNGVNNVADPEEEDVNLDDVDENKGTYLDESKLGLI